MNNNCFIPYIKLSLDNTFSKITTEHDVVTKSILQTHVGYELLNKFDLYNAYREDSDIRSKILITVQTDLLNMFKLNNIIDLLSNIDFTLLSQPNINSFILDNINTYDNNNLLLFKDAYQKAYDDIEYLESIVKLALIYLDNEKMITIDNKDFMINVINYIIDEKNTYANVLNTINKTLKNNSEKIDTENNIENTDDVENYEDTESSETTIDFDTSALDIEDAYNEDILDTPNMTKLYGETEGKENLILKVPIQMKFLLSKVPILEYVNKQWVVRKMTINVKGNNIEIPQYHNWKEIYHYLISKIKTTKLTDGSFSFDDFKESLITLLKNEGSDAKSNQIIIALMGTYYDETSSKYKPISGIINKTFINKLNLNLTIDNNGNSLVFNESNTISEYMQTFRSLLVSTFAKHSESFYIMGTKGTFLQNKPNVNAARNIVSQGIFFSSILTRNNIDGLYYFNIAKVKQLKTFILNKIKSIRGDNNSGKYSLNSDDARNLIIEILDILNIPSKYINENDFITSLKNNVSILDVIVYKDKQGNITFNSNSLINDIYNTLNNIIDISGDETAVMFDKMSADKNMLLTNSFKKYTEAVTSRVLPEVALSFLSSENKMFYSNTNINHSIIMLLYYVGANITKWNDSLIDNLKNRLHKIVKNDDGTVPVELKDNLFLNELYKILKSKSSKRIMDKMNYGILQSIFANQSSKELDKANMTPRIISYLISYQREWMIDNYSIVPMIMATTSISPIKKVHETFKYYIPTYTTTNSILSDEDYHIIYDDGNYSELLNKLTGPETELDNILAFHNILNNETKFNELNKNERLKVLQHLSFIKYDFIRNAIPDLFIPLKTTSGSIYSKTLTKLYDEFGVVNNRVMLNPIYFNINNNQFITYNFDDSSKLDTLLKQSYLKYLIKLTNETIDDITKKIIDVKGYDDILTSDYFKKMMVLYKIRPELVTDVMPSIFLGIKDSYFGGDGNLINMYNNIKNVYEIKKLVDVYNSNIDTESNLYLKYTLNTAIFNNDIDKLLQNNLVSDNKKEILENILKITQKKQGNNLVNNTFSLFASIKLGKAVNLVPNNDEISIDTIYKSFGIFNELLQKSINSKLNELKDKENPSPTDIDNIKELNDFSNVSLGFTSNDVVGFYNTVNYNKKLISHLLFEYNVNSYLHNVAMNEIMSGELGNFLVFDTKNNALSKLDTIYNYFKRNTLLRSLMIPHDIISSNVINRQDDEQYSPFLTDFVLDEKKPIFYNGYIDDIKERSNEIRKHILIRETMDVIKSNVDILFPNFRNVSKKDKKLVSKIRKLLIKESFTNDDKERLLYLDGNLSSTYHNRVDNYIDRLEPDKYDTFVKTLTDKTYLSIKKTDASDQATFIFFLKRAKAYGYISHDIADNLIQRIEERIDLAREELGKGNIEKAIEYLDYSDIINDKNLTANIRKSVTAYLKEKYKVSDAAINSIKDWSLSNISVLTMKDVFAGDVYNEKLNMNEIIFDKNATRVLLPSSIKGTKLDMLRMIMEIRRIDRVSVPSAIKTNVSKIVYPTKSEDKFWNKQFVNLQDALDWSVKNMTILELQSNDYGEQTPQVESDKSLFNSQTKAIIFTDQKDKLYEFEHLNGRTKKLYRPILGKKSFDDVQKLWSKLYSNQRDKLLNIITNAEGNIDSSKFIDYLKKNLQHSSTVTQNDINGLLTLHNIIDAYPTSSLASTTRQLIADIQNNPELKQKLDNLLNENEIDLATLTDFAIPVMFMPNSFKIQSIMNSLVETKIKSTGFKGVLVPDLLKSENITWDEYKSYITFTNPDKWNGTRDLKDIRYEDGIIQPTQVVISWNFKGLKKHYLEFDVNGKLIGEVSSSQYDVQSSTKLYKNSIGKKKKRRTNISDDVAKNIFDELSNNKYRSNKIEYIQSYNNEIKASTYIVEVLSNKKEVLDIDDFLLKEGDIGYQEGKKILNINLLPKELLKGFGTRIPTQEKSSMAYFEIVGFITGLEKSVIIAPSDFLIRMGSDFDIDTLYSLLYNYKYDPYNMKFTFIKYLPKHHDEFYYYKLYIRYIKNRFKNNNLFKLLTVDDDKKLDIDKIIESAIAANKDKNIDNIIKYIENSISDKLEHYKKVLNELSQDDINSIVSNVINNKTNVYKKKYDDVNIEFKLIHDALLEILLHSKIKKKDMQELIQLFIPKIETLHKSNINDVINNLKEIFGKYGVDTKYLIFNKKNLTYDINSAPTTEDILSKVVKYLYNKSKYSQKLSVRIKKINKEKVSINDNLLTLNFDNEYMKYSIFKAKVDMKHTIDRYYEYIKNLSNDNSQVDSDERKAQLEAIRIKENALTLMIVNDDMFTNMTLESLKNTDENKNVEKAKDKILKKINDTTSKLSELYKKASDIYNDSTHYNQKLNKINDIRDKMNKLIVSFKLDKKDLTDLGVDSKIINNEALDSLYLYIDMLNTLVDLVNLKYNAAKYANSAKFKLMVATALHGKTFNTLSFVDFKKLSEAEQNSDEASLNRLKDYYINVMAQPSNLESILLSLDYGYIYNSEGNQEISDNDFNTFIKEFKSTDVNSEKMNILMKLINQYSMASLMSKFNDVDITPDMFSWYYNELIYSQFRATSTVIGAMALNQTFQAMLRIAESKQYPIKFNSDDSIIQDNVIKLHTNDGKIIQENKYSDDYIVEDDIVTKDVKLSKYRDGSLYISLGVDDSKIQTLGRINFTVLNINATTGFLANGFGYHWPIFIMNQDIIKKLNFNYTANIDSGLSSTIAFEDAVYSTFEEFVKLLSNNTINENNFITDDMVNMNVLLEYIKSSLENGDIELSILNLTETLLSHHEYTDYNILIQLAALYNYVVAYNQGRSFSEIYAATNVDSKGTPPTYSEILDKIDKFEQLFENHPMINIEHLFGKVNYIKYNARLEEEKLDAENNIVTYYRLYDVIKLFETSINNGLNIIGKIIYNYNNVNYNIPINNSDLKESFNDFLNSIIDGNLFNNSLTIFEKLYLFKHYLNNLKDDIQPDAISIYNNLVFVVDSLLSESDRTNVLESSIIFNNDLYESIKNFNIPDAKFKLFLTTNFKDIYKLLSDVKNNLRLSNVILIPSNFKSYAIRDGLLFPRRLYSRYFKFDTPLYISLTGRLKQLAGKLMYKDRSNIKFMENFILSYFISNEFPSIDRQELSNDLIFKINKLRDYIQEQLLSENDIKVKVKLINYDKLLSALQYNGEQSLVIYDSNILHNVANIYEIYQEMFYDNTIIDSNSGITINDVAETLLKYWLVINGGQYSYRSISSIVPNAIYAQTMLMKKLRSVDWNITPDYKSLDRFAIQLIQSNPRNAMHKNLVLRISQLNKKEIKTFTYSKKNVNIYSFILSGDKFNPPIYSITSKGRGSSKNPNKVYIQLGFLKKLMFGSNVTDDEFIDKLKYLFNNNVDNIVQIFDIDEKSFKTKLLSFLDDKSGLNFKYVQIDNLGFTLDGHKVIETQNNVITPIGFSSNNDNMSIFGYILKLLNNEMKMAYDEGREFRVVINTNELDQAYDSNDGSNIEIPKDSILDFTTKSLDFTYNNIRFKSLSDALNYIVFSNGNKYLKDNNTLTKMLKDVLNIYIEGANPVDMPKNIHAFIGKFLYLRSNNSEDVNFLNALLKTMNLNETLTTDDIFNYLSTIKQNRLTNLSNYFGTIFELALSQNAELRNGFEELETEFISKNINSISNRNANISISIPAYSIYYGKVKDDYSNNNVYGNLLREYILKKHNVVDNIVVDNDDITKLENNQNIIIPISESLYRVLNLNTPVSLFSPIKYVSNSKPLTQQDINNGYLYITLNENLVGDNVIYIKLTDEQKIILAERDKLYNNPSKSNIDIERLKELNIQLNSIIFNYLNGIIEKQVKTENASDIVDDNDMYDMLSFINTEELNKFKSYNTFDKINFIENKLQQLYNLNLPALDDKIKIYESILLYLTTDNNNYTLNEMTGFSGAAEGADKSWNEETTKAGMKFVDYLISDINDELDINILNMIDREYKRAADILHRPHLSYKSNNPDIVAQAKLIMRDFLQVKSGQSVYAVSDIIKPGEYGKKNRKNIAYQNTTDKDVVDGGTGYAVQMAINHNKPVYVYNQKTKELENNQTELGWYKWNYETRTFDKIDYIPILTKNFTAIGTRQLNSNGKRAIKDVVNATVAQVKNKKNVTSNTIDIYDDLLGSTTKRNNIMLPENMPASMIYIDAQQFKKKIVPEFKKDFPDGIIAFRMDKDLLKAYQKQNAIGNPFTVFDEKGSETEKVGKATKKFIDWILTGNNYGVSKASDKYRDALLADFKSGKHKGKSILYYVELKRPTHATALDYFINEHNWDNENNVQAVNDFDEDKINIPYGDILDKSQEKEGINLNTDSEKVTSDIDKIKKQIEDTKVPIVLDMGISSNNFHKIVPKNTKHMTGYVVKMFKQGNIPKAEISRYRNIIPIDLVRESNILTDLKDLINGRKLASNNGDALKQQESIISELSKLLKKPEYKFIIDRIAGNIDNVNTKNFIGDFNSYPFLKDINQLLEYIKSALFIEYDYFTAHNLKVEYDHNFSTIDGKMPDNISYVLISNENYKDILNDGKKLKNITLVKDSTLLPLVTIGKSYKSLRSIGTLNKKQKSNLSKIVKTISDLSSLDLKDYFDLSMSFINSIPNDNIGMKIINTILKLDIDNKIYMKTNVKSAFIKKYISIFTNITINSVDDAILDSYIISVKKLDTQTKTLKIVEDTIDITTNDSVDSIIEPLLSLDGISKLKKAIEILNNNASITQQLIQKMKDKNIIPNKVNSVDDLNSALDYMNC